MNNVNNGFGGWFNKYTNWDFMNASSGKPSSGGAPIAPGAGVNDLTNAQKIGHGGQIGTTLLRDIFSEQDARAQRARELEEANAKMASDFQSKLPALIQARQDLGRRTAALSSLSRMF